MRKIVKCESNNNPEAVGDKGTSFGLVQIHLTAHPNITIEQAEDTEFALNFLASNLAEGHSNMWSCYPLVRDS